MALISELPLQELFSEFHYLAPFTVLLLCGVGLPLPEEITLIGSGLLLHQHPEKVDFVTISIVCGTAILLGDTIPYLVGRRFGMSILRLGWISRILHPERFALLEERFAEHGNWAVFTCRFLPGVRIPGYFLAGTLRMRYTRFLALDALGVLISVPASIYLGKVFAGSVDKLRERFADLHLILAFGVLSLILILAVRHWIRTGVGAVQETPREPSPEKDPDPEPGPGEEAAQEEDLDLESDRRLGPPDRRSDPSGQE